MPSTERYSDVQADATRAIVEASDAAELIELKRVNLENIVGKIAVELEARRGERLADQNTVRAARVR